MEFTSQLFKTLKGVFNKGVNEESRYNPAVMNTPSYDATSKTGGKRTLRRAKKHTKKNMKKNGGDSHEQASHLKGSVDGMMTGGKRTLRKAKKHMKKYTKKNGGDSQEQASHLKGSVHGDSHEQVSPLKGSVDGEMTGGVPNSRNPRRKSVIQRVHHNTYSVFRGNPINIRQYHQKNQKHQKHILPRIGESHPVKNTNQDDSDHLMSLMKKLDIGKLAKRRHSKKHTNEVTYDKDFDLLIKEFSRAEISKKSSNIYKKGFKKSRKGKKIDRMSDGPTRSSVKKPSKKLEKMSVVPERSSSRAKKPVVFLRY